jgi:hypothetical protein
MNQIDCTNGQYHMDECMFNEFYDQTSQIQWNLLHGRWKVSYGWNSMTIVPKSKNMVEIQLMMDDNGQTILIVDFIHIVKFMCAF